MDQYGDRSVRKMTSAAGASHDGVDERLRGQGLHAGVAGQVKRIQPRVPGATVPISAEQYRVWLHSSQQPDVPLYNEAITIHKHGSFDLKTFEAAFNEVLRRHEVWRTSFGLADGELVQIVHPDLRVELPLVDLSGFTHEEREAEALRLATEDARKPLDMEQAPLFRARIVRMGPEEHRFMLTLHHIIFDGVSIYRTLMPELSAIYAAFESGMRPPLPEPQLQYGDYAIWRQRHVESADVQEHLDYWREQLAGELPVLRLPVDRPRPARISHRGSMECFQIPAERIDALRQLSRAHRVTLYVTLLAAFKTLLFRYSSQEDVIVGGATDARRRTELEPLMGYFLDTFAVRTLPTAEKTFSEYLREVREAVLGALSAAEVPFDRVVQAVNPRRDNSHHPIFQAFFSIEPPVEPFAGGWDLTQMDVTVGASKFDLYLELDERPDHMAARFMYNTDIFDAVTIRRMSGHWKEMLESVCRTPDAKLGDLHFLSAEEMAQLDGPGGWNDTAEHIPTLPLHRLIEEQAERRPQVAAVVQNDRRWTYAELDNRATELAGVLRAAGAGPGTLVAVFLQRSLDMLAGLIAVWKTGAAYVPLDPETPQARIALCLEDAKPVVVLTTTSLREMLGEYASQSISADLIGVSGESANISTSGQSLGEVQGTDIETAYVIHTSGTTGKPKAVEIAHRSLINLLAAAQREVAFGPDDVLLAVTTISFDIAALELFLPLISGGTVLLASREEAKDPYLLAARMEASGCTVMQATPSTWRALLQTGWKGPSRPLRVLCGGEPLPRTLADRLLATGVALWNMYGPTETTVWSTVSRVSHGEGPVTVGKPIANTTAYVLDERDQLQPVNVPGELLLGGAGLAKGYRSQPQATAEKFVTVEAIGPARVYRTGDLVVRRADGSLECMGRIDNQVKVRGFRVELEAVETAAQMHPKVVAAAARVWPESDGGMRLSLYVVSRDGVPQETRTLRQFLQMSLPEYMVPSDILTLPELPLTPNGKIDRKALPPLSASRPLDPVPSRFVGTRDSLSDVEVEDPRRVFEAPQPGIETAIASVWRDVLNVKELGRNDSFFELGGHSLEAVRCVSLVNRALGSSIRFASFLRAPTIAQLANIVQGGAAPKIQLAKQGPPASKQLLWMGTGEWLTLLARRLGSDVTLYGVAPDVEQLKDLSVEAMAAQMLPDVLNLQGGPFVIGGFCLRGFLALELARRLHEKGATVELLILGDVFAPRRASKLTIPQRVIRRAHREFWNLRNALRQPSGRRRQALRRLLVSWREWQDVNLDDPDIPDEVLEALYAVGQDYKPVPFPGRVLFLESGEHRVIGRSTSESWSDFIRNIEVARFPGIHENFLFEFYLDAFVRRLEEAMRSSRDVEPV